MITPRAGLVPVGPRSQANGDEGMIWATGGACLRRAVIRKSSFRDAYNDLLTLNMDKPHGREAHCASIFWFGL